MESLDWHNARAALEWQLDLGADEAIQDTPVDRYALEAKVAAPAASVPPAAHSGARAAQMPVANVGPDVVAEAEAAARAAQDLAGLRAAMEQYPHCDLKAGARNLVFSDGVAGAPLMILSGAPGRDEDREGKPFVGRAKTLLDRMLDAIGMSVERDVYVATVLPYRPPQDREPKAAEIAMMVPFLRRHVELAAPKALICMGPIACGATLGKSGISRLRGTWSEAFGVATLPMLHPASLLRQPHAKRDAWADLLAIKARLRD